MEKYTRFKTKQEFEKEFGSNWRNKCGKYWSANMEDALGEPFEYKEGQLKLPKTKGEWFIHSNHLTTEPLLPIGTKIAVPKTKLGKENISNIHIYYGGFNNEGHILASYDCSGKSGFINGNYYYASEILEAYERSLKDVIIDQPVKLKVGDKVRCKPGFNNLDNNRDGKLRGGSGYIEGAEYIIKSFTNLSNGDIFWSTCDKGVWCHAVELIEAKQEELLEPKAVAKEELQLESGRWYYGETTIHDKIIFKYSKDHTSLSAGAYIGYHKISNDIYFFENSANYTSKKNIKRLATEDEIKEVLIYAAKQKGYSQGVKVINPFNKEHCNRQNDYFILKDKYSVSLCHCREYFGDHCLWVDADRNSIVIYSDAKNEWASIVKEEKVSKDLLKEVVSKYKIGDFVEVSGNEAYGGCGFNGNYITQLEEKDINNATGILKANAHFSVNIDNRQYNITLYNILRLATKEHIRNHLLTQAKEKYKVGDKVFDPVNNREREITGSNFTFFDNVEGYQICGDLGVTVYLRGEWAEVIDYEALLKEAKLKYPIGTKFKAILSDGTCSNTVAIQKQECYLYKSDNKTWIIGSANIMNPNKQWAEIITESKEDLLEQAKKKYPVGTKYKCPRGTGNYPHIFEVESSDEIKLYVSNSKDIDIVGKGFLHYNNQWAEIIVDDPISKQDALFKEAKERYPVGTKFRIAHEPSKIVTVKSHDQHINTFIENKGLHINLKIEEHANSDANSASVYFNGKWAEIVEIGKSNIDITQFYNIKVDCKTFNNSELLQKFLFKLGFKWEGSGAQGVKVEIEARKYIKIDSNKTFVCSDKSIYNSRKEREVPISYFKQWIPELETFDLDNNYVSKLPNDYVNVNSVNINNNLNQNKNNGKQDNNSIKVQRQTSTISRSEGRTENSIQSRKNKSTIERDSSFYTREISSSKTRSRIA
jgi:hypothetical protein